MYKERFYDSNGVKKVPDDLIDDFTELSLAHWYMDSGYKAHGGYYISVTKFSEQDQIKLLELLQGKFNLPCRLRKSNNKNHIFFNTAPEDFFLNTIKPYVDSIPGLSNKLFNIIPFLCISKSNSLANS